MPTAAIPPSYAPEKPQVDANSLAKLAFGKPKKPPKVAAIKRTGAAPKPTIERIGSVLAFMPSHRSPNCYPIVPVIPKHGLAR